MTAPMTRIDLQQFGPWAVVTGASSGIGKEFARQLAASGLNLVLVARRLALLEVLGNQLASQFGVQYRAVGVDLAEPDFLETIEAATEDLEVGLLISNAGTGHPSAFLTQDAGELLTHVQLNALAHLRLTHHFGRRMAERGRGGVLLVSALGAKEGLPYMANDGAAKAYVLSLGEALHVEFQKLGLHLTVLLPGPTATEGVAASGFDMPMKPMSVEQCVAEGLAALRANRSTHIAGRMNRLMTALIPGSLMQKMMGTMLARAIAGKHPGVGLAHSMTENIPQ